MRSLKRLAWTTPLLFLGLLGWTPAWSAWAPTKPIEMVVGAGPGGGSDIIMRTMASIIEAEKLCPEPMVVINKPGGGSTVGTTYVVQQRKNPHVLYGYHPGQIIAPVTAGLELATAKNLTMIAAVAIDEQLIVVKADSPYKTLKDLVAAAKQRSLSVAGTTTGQDDHICNRLFERAADVKTRYVAFNSGGEVVTALLGGHVDYIWANPSEFSAQLDAKQVRALGVARSERFPLLPNVPTFKEQGYPIVYQMFRGVVAPPEIPNEAVAFYEGMLKKMTQSQRWRDGYIKEYMLSPAWMGHTDLTKLVQDQEQVSRAILKELGLVK